MKAKSEKRPKNPDNIIFNLEYIIKLFIKSEHRIKIFQAKYQKNVFLLEDTL